MLLQCSLEAQGSSTKPRESLVALPLLPSLPPITASSKGVTSQTFLRCDFPPSPSPHPSLSCHHLLLGLLSRLLITHPVSCHLISQQPGQFFVITNVHLPFAASPPPSIIKCSYSSIALTLRTKTIACFSSPSTHAPFHCSIFQLLKPTLLPHPAGPLHVLFPVSGILPSPADNSGFYQLSA